MKRAKGLAGLGGADVFGLCLNEYAGSAPNGLCLVWIFHLQNKELRGEHQVCGSMGRCRRQRFYCQALVECDDGVAVGFEGMGGGKCRSKCR